MSKDYQKKTAPVGTDAELVLFEAVNLAMAEIGGAVKEGLLALAVAAGLQVMTTMMEEGVTALAGPEGPSPARPGRGPSRQRGGVGVLGGRRVPVRRPRVRASDGSGELPVAAYDVFSSTDLLGEMALERMMARLSTRRCQAGLEPVGAAVEASARATSKSSVSRRFVARTETALTELMAAQLSGLDIVAVMIDGVHFAEHCCVVAGASSTAAMRSKMVAVASRPSLPNASRISASRRTPSDWSLAAAAG